MTTPEQNDKADTAAPPSTLEDARRRQMIAMAAARQTPTPAPPPVNPMAALAPPPVNPMAALAPDTPTGLAAFDTTAPADDFEPIPPGVYVARVLSGEYTQTRKGEDSYRMRFEVSGGPMDGRTVIRTWTFGPKALPYAKRDLALFGLTKSEHLLTTYPPPYQIVRVRLVVALQVGDDGLSRNDIKKITVLGTENTPDAAYLLPTTAPEQPSEGGPSQ